MGTQNENYFNNEKYYFRLLKEIKFPGIRNIFLISLFLFIPLLAGCATVISSPEGTITSYVRDKRVQVYAPRSARAQKVLFDTADKQMIHEPDTPFRQFFNSHSADFRPGKVDYAKTTILNDLVNRIRNMEYVRGMVGEVIERHKESAINPTNASTPSNKEKQNRNAKLLKDALYNALVDEGYPDIRDNRIHNILEKFFGESVKEINTQYNSIWKGTTTTAKNFSAFKLDLMQTLREKQFFRKVIDDSVAKRLALFKSPGSPYGGVKNALSLIKKFLERINTDSYLEKFSKTKESLWQSFLIENKSSFKMPTGGNIDVQGLLAQGNKIRADFQEKLQTIPDIKQAFSKVLEDPNYQDFLQAGDPADSRAAVQSQWPAKIAGYQSVIDKHASLETITKELKRLLDELTPTIGLRDSTKKTYVDLLRDSLELFNQIAHSSQEIEKAIIKFEKTEKSIAFDRNVDKLDSINVIEVVHTVHKNIAMAVAKADWPATHWDAIDKARIALSEGLKHLNEDKNLNSKLDNANTNLINLRTAKQYNSDPLIETTAIIRLSGNFKTSGQRLKVKAAALSQKLKEFVDAVEALAAAKKFTITPEINVALSKIDAIDDDVHSFTPNATIADDSFSGAVRYLIDTAKPNLSLLSDKFQKYKEKRDDHDLKKVAFDNQQQNLFKGAKDSLKTEVEKAITHYNQSLSSVNQLNSVELKTLKDNVQTTLEGKLAPFAAGKSESVGTLLEILNPSFNNVPFTADTSSTRDTLANAFHKVFDGYVELVKTDGPILTEILKSEKIKFAGKDLQNAAVKKIPAAFFDKMSKATPPYAATIEDNLTAVLEAPANSYVFGQGASSSAIVEGFKEELYNAFKNNLTEAVEAERKANYDYWWLTFYPKAIPLGDNSIEGQSIIEINFPKRVVPETQYRRWLQDSPDLRFGIPKPPCSEECSAHKPVDPFKNKLQIATSVLNDFRSVLDSSDLTKEYGHIRDHLTEALARFTNGVNNKTKYRKGLKFLFDKAVLEQNQRNESFRERLKKDQEIIDAALEKLKNDLKKEKEQTKNTKPKKQALPTKYYDALKNKYYSLIPVVGHRRFNPLDTDSLSPTTPDDDSHPVQPSPDQEDSHAHPPSSPHLISDEIEDLQKKIAHLEELKTQNLALLNQNPTLEDLINKDPDLKKWFDKNPGLEELLRKNATFKELLRKDIKLKNLLANQNKKPEELNAFYDKYPKLKELIKRNEQLNKILNDFPRFKSLYEKYPSLRMSSTYSPPLTLASTPLTIFFNEVKYIIDTNYDFDDFLKENISFYRNAFAWEDFDIRHVFFAVLVAAEKHIVLPQKVELFTNAYFNGVFRFAPEFSPREEQEILKNYIYEKILKELDTKRFVVPFKNLDDFSETARYLLLKGIRLKDLSRMLTRYLALTHQTKNMSFIGQIFTGLCTDSKYKPAGGNCGEKIFKGQEDLTTDNNCDEILGSKSNGKEPQNEIKTSTLQVLQCISKEKEKNLDSYKFEESFNSLGTYSTVVNNHIKKFLFYGIKYNKYFKRDPYLTSPELWPFEQKLDESREELRTIIVNKFHTNYPGIPDPDIIKEEYLSHPDRIESLIYLWLRDLWMNREIGDLKVITRHFLDKSPFLTKDAVNEIINVVTSNQNDIKKWITNIKNKQFLSDQLATNLLDHVYGPFFNALDQLTKVERHSTPLDQVKKEKFKSFAHWGKPKIQKGIQVVDMLPASRDDLVSMSVNEGGAIANIAAKAEGAAAYDLNQLQTVLRNAELLRQALNDNSSSNTQGESEGIGTLAETLSQTLTNSRQQEFSDLSELNQGANLGAYSLGATAGGSIYSRARSAFAYSKRREYLDAAITAAGRGDHFAKWVVRKSDIRTPILQQLGDRGDLLAARHNGYPNGDQPFHLLVKIPHNSVQKDWDGTPYILFNSSYVATKRLKSWERYGNLAPILKLPLWIINPSWWSKMEETVVGTAYPFKWDVVDSQDEQAEMLRERNYLGGRIKLDDTDKIKFSEILGRIEAEKNFIKYTREAQSQDILRTMNELKQEEPDFRKTTNQSLQQQLNDMQTLQQSQRTNANIDTRRQDLQTQIEQIRQILTPPPPADPAPAPAAPADGSTSSANQPALPGTAAAPPVNVPQAETAVIVQTNR